MTDGIDPGKLSLPTGKTPEVSEGGEGGEGNQTGTTHLNIDAQLLADNPWLEESKDINELATRLINNKGRADGSIKVPGKDASEDAVAKFQADLIEKVPGLMVKPGADNQDEVYKFLGRPENAEGYKAPEGLDLTGIEDVANLAAVAGLTQDQYVKMVGALRQGLDTQTEAVNAGTTEAWNALKAEWEGAAEPRILQAKAIANKYLGTDAIDASTAKALYNLAADLGAFADNSNPLVGGEANNAKYMTVDQIDAEINEIKADAQGPYFNPADPRHDAVRKKVFELTQQKIDAKAGK